jgi:hypothetical protein
MTAAPPTCCRQKKWLVLREKLEANATSLSRQGGLVFKKTAAGRRVSAVRFVVADGGQMVHRSIYVGADMVLLERTRRLLEYYRSVAALPRQLAAWARMLAVACGTVRRVLRRFRCGARFPPTQLVLDWRRGEGDPSFFCCSTSLLFPVWASPYSVRPQEVHPCPMCKGGLPRPASTLETNVR